ncbi:hypothetical protein AAAC51_06065 [Priestia megaterium]
MNERIALYRDKMKVFWNNRKRTKIALIAAPLAAILVISLASVF